MTLKHMWLVSCCLLAAFLNASAETVHLDVGSLQGEREPVVAAGPAGTALTQQETAVLQWAQGKPLSVTVTYAGVVKPTGSGGQFANTLDLSAEETVEAYLNGLMPGNTRSLWGDSITGEGGTASATFSISGFDADTVYRVRLLSMRKNGWYGSGSPLEGIYTLTAEGLGETNSGWRQQDATGTGNVAAAYPIRNENGVMTATYPSSGSGLCQYLVWEFRTPADWKEDRPVVLEARGNFCIAGVGVTREPTDETDPIPDGSGEEEPAILIADPVEVVASDASIPASGVVWHNQVGEWKDSRPQTSGSTDNSWAKNSTPIGNGRLGGLIYGGCATDHMELTEISLWSGRECSVNQKPANNGTGPNSILFGSYLPFATFAADHYGTGTAADYRRVLDLKTGTASVSYRVGETKFRREYFASEPHQVIVMTETASTPGALNVRVRFSSLLPGVAFTVENQTIVQRGTLNNGLVYEGRYRVLHQGGTLTVNADGSLTLKGADSMTVLMSMGTNYVMDESKNWKGNDPSVLVSARLKEAAAVDVSALKAAHVKDYQRLFNRSSLKLGTSMSAAIHNPIPSRIQAYKQALDNGLDPGDPELEALLFDFGRYLIISSSRKGNLPANLQGLWNYSLYPPWDADYHNNINVEMCYWASEIVNLGECNMPLIDYIEAMIPSARRITQKQFGTNVRGWTARTAQNIFGGQGFQWNNPASAWYMLHVWEWYQFSRDEQYLRERAYPMMKEVCHFWEDTLKELTEGGGNFFSAFGDATAEKKAVELADVKAGTLVAPNGWSPEQGQREDGVAHDQQIIWELFDNTVKAAEILDVDREWITSLKDKRDRLAGPKINSQGRLQEWMLDRNTGNPGHRHTSHLFAVYPGSRISMEQTPELAEAARKALAARGDSGDSRRSWAWAWRCNLWARLQQAERAHDMIEGLFRYNMLNSMFTTHPPMQIDGNLGIVAGFAEMLLQSHAGVIHLLPALPDAWPEGSVKGFKARGDVTVDFSWKDGRVTSWRLASPTREPVQLKVNGTTQTVKPASYNDPAVPLLTVTPGEWTAPAGGGTQAVVVSSNEPWTVSVPQEASWLALSRTAGDSGDEVTLTASPHTVAGERSAIVTFSTSVLTRTVAVAQAGTPPLTGYEKWKKDHFKETTVDSSPEGNPAGDGITNLMKYATGLDPLKPCGSVTTLTVKEQDGKKYLMLAWPVNAEAADVVFSVESSENLKDWVEESGLKVTEKSGEYRDTVEINGMGPIRRFLRLKVTRD